MKGKRIKMSDHRISFKKRMRLVRNYKICKKEQPELYYALKQDREEETRLRLMKAEAARVAKADILIAEAHVDSQVSLLANHQITSDSCVSPSIETEEDAIDPTDLCEVKIECGDIKIQREEIHVLKQTEGVPTPISGLRSVEPSYCINALLDIVKTHYSEQLCFYPDVKLIGEVAREELTSTFVYKCSYCACEWKIASTNTNSAYQHT